MGLGKLCRHHGLCLSLVRRSGRGLSPKYEGSVTMSDFALDMILLIIIVLMPASSIAIFYAHRKALRVIMKDLRQPGEWRKTWAFKEKMKARQKSTSE